MTDHQIRYRLWCLCPHHGKYGDDGEMQCQGVQPWDFRRAPLLELVDHVAVALQEEFRRVRDEAYRSGYEEGKRWCRDSIDS